MSTERLLEIVKNRGLEIRWHESGEPFLFRPKGNVNATDELLTVLKFHKDRLRKNGAECPKSEVSF